MSTVNELREHARLLECRAAFIGDDNTGSAQMERDALDAAARLLEREACALCETARRAIELLQRWHDQDVSSEDYEQMIADFLAQVTKEP